jgi:hypothetical protein
MAKNPKLHTTSCKWTFADDGAGTVGTQADIKDSPNIPDNAIITSCVMYVKTAPGGAGGGIKIALNGTSDPLVCEFSGANIGTAENVIAGALKGGKAVGVSKVTISPVTAVFSTGGDIRFVFTYVLGA